MPNLRVVVDRSRWYRGNGGSASYLLRPADNTMCCVGFACLAAGLTPEQIRGEKTVAALGNISLRLPEKWRQPTLMHDLYVPNDSDTVTEVEREETLIERGKAAGIEFEFVDGVKP